MCKEDYFIMRRHAFVLITAFVLGALAFLIACGGGGGTTTSTAGTGMVSTTLSDPATCSASGGGIYVSVWVTIKDVKIHTSATAGDNDPGWIDLTPNLPAAPKQIDLLADTTKTNQCFLATLGANTALQPGTYQQIRIYLADNSATSVNLIGGAASNNCKDSVTANCVVTTSSSTPQPLLLSSEVNTGIKIPSGQIAGGNFTIAAGQTKDLNLDFDTCASMVMQGNGQFRLKPVLHAGEVSLTSVSINGKLFDKNTGAAIVGGKAIVALELKDANGVDRIVLPPTTTDSTGAFNFCPVPMLPAGQSYDVVAVAVNGANVAYAATITTGVQPGNALGNVPMYPVAANSTGSVAPGSFKGQITSVNASSNGTAIDALLSLLQAGSSTTFTIPANSQSGTLGVTTAKPSGCAADPCPAYTVTYTFDVVPPVAPTMGAFSTTPPTNYVPGSLMPPASYAVEGQAFVPGSGNTTDCNPNNTMKTASFNVNPGSSNPDAPTIAFTGCT
jgi:hypothetical protein